MKIDNFDQRTPAVKFIPSSEHKLMHFQHQMDTDGNLARVLLDKSGHLTKQIIARVRARLPKAETKVERLEREDKEFVESFIEVLREDKAEGNYPEWMRDPDEMEQLLTKGLKRLRENDDVAESAVDTLEKKDD